MLNISLDLSVHYVKISCIIFYRLEKPQGVLFYNGFFCLFFDSTKPFFLQYKTFFLQYKTILGAPCFRYLEKSSFLQLKI